MSYFHESTHSVQIQSFTVADQAKSLNAGWNMLLPGNLFPVRPSQWLLPVIEETNLI